MAFPLSQAELRDYVVSALGEDLGKEGDITSAAVINEDVVFNAVICARESMVICGLPLAVAFFQALSNDIQITLYASDGDTAEAGDNLMRVEGPARAILSAERPALNALQHLSGIATTSKFYVERLSGTKARLLDTRKTIPGYRKLAKYATSCGGADNHRIGLYDAILIKDNHIAVAGGIAEAIKAAKAAGHQKIEVECDTLDQLDEALANGATRVLLDNMTLENMRTAVERVNGRISLEASGNVTLETIRDIAETGVDFISVGTALTLSARAVDIGLDYVNQ
ncbi:MAG: carboxylating nicotinate-nucleotide diphosphorylase [Sphingomonadales bacterium]